jgi:DNA-binding transcriptional MerR regulator
VEGVDKDNQQNQQAPAPSPSRQDKVKGAQTASRLAARHSSYKNPKMSKNSSKSSSAFKTISEVADLLDVQQHVLRFWETKFSQIKPLKRGGGRRYYRPEDIELLQAIHTLLYKDGYTIKGVQNLFRKNGKNNVIEALSDQDDEHAINLEQPVLKATSPQRYSELAGQETSDTQNDLQNLNATQKEVLSTVLTELKAMRDLLDQTK